MATLNVRDLDEQLLGRLKAAARAHNRSLAGEVREALAAYVAEQDQVAAWDRRATWLDGVRAIAARSRPGPAVAELMAEARRDWDGAERRS